MMDIIIAAVIVYSVCSIIRILLAGKKKHTENA